jgi:hypothetical protein
MWTLLSCRASRRIHSSNPKSYSQHSRSKYKDFHLPISSPLLFSPLLLSSSSSSPLLLISRILLYLLHSGTVTHPSVFLVTQSVLALHILLVLFENLPFWLLLLGIVAHVTYLSLLTTFPFIDMLDKKFIASCGSYRGSCILPHLLYRSRPFSSPPPSLDKYFLLFLRPPFLMSSFSSCCYRSHSLVPLLHSTLPSFL